MHAMYVNLSCAKEFDLAAFFSPFEERCLTAEVHSATDNIVFTCVGCQAGCIRVWKDKTDASIR